MSSQVSMYPETSGLCRAKPHARAAWLQSDLMQRRTTVSTASKIVSDFSAGIQKPNKPTEPLLSRKHERRQKMGAHLLPWHPNLGTANLRFQLAPSICLFEELDLQHCEEDTFPCQGIISDQLHAGRSLQTFPMLNIVNCFTTTVCLA